jgi:hypothetical protein
VHACYVDTPVCLLPYNMGGPVYFHQPNMSQGQPGSGYISCCAYLGNPCKIPGMRPSVVFNAVLCFSTLASSEPPFITCSLRHFVDCPGDNIEAGIYEVFAEACYNIRSSGLAHFADRWSHLNQTLTQKGAFTTMTPLHWLATSSRCAHSPLHPCLLS